MDRPKKKAKAARSCLHRGGNVPGFEQSPPLREPNDLPPIRAPIKGFRVYRV